MTEFTLVLMGVILALCAVLAAAAAFFAMQAKQACATGRAESDAALVTLRESAAAIVEEHNALVKVQAEQAQTLEAIGAEVAARSLRR